MVLGFCVLIGFSLVCPISSLLYAREGQRERERERERDIHRIKSIAHHVLFLFFEESSGDIFVTQ